MLENSYTITGNIIDIPGRKIRHGRVTILDGLIHDIEADGPEVPGDHYILPGFIDAHIHIESSMVTPPAFARIAVIHGTVATVSDPHEIANVCGIEGVRYMADLGKKSGFTFFFGAPSCVPATPFETAGATLTAAEINQLFEEKNCHYLSEMMNYPAVLARDPLVMDKIRVAQQRGLPVDGHAPGLRGQDAAQYAVAGITTDHECTTLEEALDKIAAGMHILIREGSAAKNYDALHSLIRSHPDRVMFCSDDKHPDDLLRGHINQLVTRSLSLGYDLFDVLRAACINPAAHYHLPSGTLEIGHRADLIVVAGLKDFEILSTWIDGVQVYDGQEVILPEVYIPAINQFAITPIQAEDLQLELDAGPAQIIVAINGSIVTGSKKEIVKSGNFEGDRTKDVLKLVVVNRYHQAPVAKALIHGFGLNKGAIASSVAHDSHNILAVGTNDEDLITCINKVIENKGGVAASFGELSHILPLPIAGLMSDADAETVGRMYEKIDRFVKAELGSTLTAPYMTLSFMALLVIPTLKLSDLGLFDGVKFEFTSLQ
jgi:adenine deaminase